MGIILKLFYFIFKNFGCCVKQRQAEFNHSQTNIVLLSTFDILYIIVGVTKQIFARERPSEDALFIPNHEFSINPELIQSFLLPCLSQRV